MLLSLRALFFSVPALIVLIGGYYVAPKISPVEEGAQPAGSYVASIEWPSEADEDVVRRVALKQECTLDLLNGYLTLNEAVERFRLISTTSARVSSESENDSRFIQQVILFARTHAARDSGRYRVACSELEAVARAMERNTENTSLHDSGSPFGS